MTASLIVLLIALAISASFNLLMFWRLKTYDRAVDILLRVANATDDYLRFMCRGSSGSRPLVVIIAASEEAKDMHASRMNEMAHSLQAVRGLPEANICQTSDSRVPDSEMPQDPLA